MTDKAPEKAPEVKAEVAPTRFGSPPSPSDNAHAAACTAAGISKAKDTVDSKFGACTIHSDDKVGAGVDWTFTGKGGALSKVELHKDGHTMTFEKKGDGPNGQTEWTSTVDGDKAHGHPLYNLKASEDGKTLQWTEKNGDKLTMTPDATKDELANPKAIKETISTPAGDNTNIPTDAARKLGFMPTKVGADGSIDVGSMVEGGNGLGLHVGPDGKGVMYFGNGQKSEMSRQLSPDEMKQWRSATFVRLNPQMENGKIKEEDGHPVVNVQLGHSTE